MVELNYEQEVSGARPVTDATEHAEVRKDSRPAQTNGELVFKHYNANGAGGHRGTEDVDMQ